MLDGEGKDAAPAPDVGADAQSQIDAADSALAATIDAALDGGEAPAGQPSAPAKAAPAGEPAAQPRDKAGRFTEKPPASEPAPQADEAPAPAPETTDEPTAETAEQPTGEKPEGAEDEAAAVQFPEEIYRSDGNEVAIPGSQVGENGVFIPKAQWNDTQQLIALGRAAREGSIRSQLTDFGRERARLNAQIQGALAARDAVYAKIDEMIEADQRGDAEKGFLKWGEDLLANWRILKSEGIAKQKDLELAEANRQLTEANEAQERAQREPQMLNVLRTEVARHGQAAGLDAEGQQALVERLNSLRYRDLAFPRATEDDPITGARKGEYLIDYDFIKDEVAHFVRAGGGRKEVSAERLKQMQAENARRLAAGNKAPPVAGAKRGPAPAPALNTNFKSAQEADEEIFDKGGWQRLAGG